MAKSRRFGTTDKSSASDAVDGSHHRHHNVRFGSKADIQRVVVKRLLVTLIGINVADLSQDDFVLQPFDKTVRISSPPSTGHATGADFPNCPIHREIRDADHGRNDWKKNRTEMQ
ncbi:MAG: hypothetical protein O7I42_18355 [Alphaproteobacteria bacterium]|nr:hypothetical protein [Alphaproteobacteria bacterium]